MHINSLEFSGGAVVFTALIYIFRRMKRKKKPGMIAKDFKMPAEIWFYSRLLDLEIGNLDYELYLPLYQEYLGRRYATRNIPKERETFINYLKEKEEDPKTQRFLAALYFEIAAVKQKGKEEVINHIKEIKFNFNQADLTAWLAKLQNTC